MLMQGDTNWEFMMECAVGISASAILTRPLETAMDRLLIEVGASNTLTFGTVTAKGGTRACSVPTGWYRDCSLV